MHFDFFKGSTLKCAWCDNPESQSTEYDIVLDEKICMVYGDYTKISNGSEIELKKDGLKVYRKKIKDVFRYKNVCPTGALTVIGKTLSVESIIEEMKVEKKYLPIGTLLKLQKNTMQQQLK